MNFHSIFQFLPFPVKSSAVTKVRYYHRVISSTNTMRTINARVWDINTCFTKPALNCFQDFIGGFIFLFPYFFDSQIEASTILLHTVWLRLTSREQLMSPECSKHQVLSLAKMLVVWWTNKKYFVLISVLQSAQLINAERIYPQTRVSSFAGLISMAQVNE